MEMNKKSIKKNFDEKIRKLTIADNYMFFSVMTSNDDICKEVVEICIGRAVYRFCNRERDDRDLTLEDGSYKILINARRDESGCSEGMRQLMAAARGETITDDGLDRRIAEAVSRMKADAEWRMEYMLYEIEMNERWEAGFAEGEEKGREKGREEGLGEGLKKGREEGLREGKKEGELFTLYDLVLSGDLPENVAVKKSGRSKKDFCAGLEEYRQSRCS